ncbi:hypothetical protein Adt_12241 [Abeliophyllum distichum]|uniref:Uncharacterized protein n=1 Tax=Abeliophyllum distichum TaxID=126358 RepID=A0ABD1UQ61_9LAMI
MLVGRKLDFSYIMLHHMNTVHRGHRPMALPYEMILTKIFQHHQISFRDEAVKKWMKMLLLRPRSHRPSSSASGVNEDQFNLLSGRIDSLTSTVDGMQLAVNDLHNTATSIQATVDGI